MSTGTNVTPERLALMLALQGQFRTQASIAAELGLARETVSRALSKHNRATAKRLAKDADQERGRQLDQLDAIAEKAIAGYDGPDGSPAHLAQARGALADKRKLLGLDAPDEVQHGGAVKIIVQYKNAGARRAPPGAG